MNPHFLHHSLEKHLLAALGALLGFIAKYLPQLWPVLVGLYLLAIGVAVIACLFPGDPQVIEKSDPLGFSTQTKIVRPPLLNSDSRLRIILCLIAVLFGVIAGAFGGGL